MILFIGWWQETGLALLNVPCTAPLSQLFSRPKHRHTVPARVFSCTILVDFRTEDQDDMRNTLRVRWTIIPQTAPQPWIACSGCGGLRAFQSSGKIRFNANGRKLDAWLICKCLSCEKTWNRPIFERQNVRAINPVVLEALRSNDPQWIRTETFNLEALRRKSQRVDEFSEFEIGKDILRETPNWTKLELELMVPFSVSTRLDRLLASELKVSRARLQTFHDKGTLRTNSDRADILRRRIKTGTQVTIDLSTEADREQLWKPLATGSPL
jgi:hypothetical protein